MKDMYISDSGVVNGHEVNIKIPVSHILARHIIFPDYGSRVEGEPLPADMTIEQYETTENRPFCESIIEDFRDYYPETLAAIGEEALMERLLSDNLKSWAEQKDLDLRPYFA